jgi:hypothetical protein
MRWRRLGYRQPLSSPRRDASGFCNFFRPSENRGRREDRVRAAPAVSRAKCDSKTHTSIQVQRKHSGLPRAMVLTVSFALFPVIGLSCHRHPRECPACRTRRADIAIIANLTPASRHQNHTTSPSDQVPFVSDTVTSTASRLTFVTIAKRPSERRDDESIKLLLPCGEAKYFCRWGWTRKWRDGLTGKSPGVAAGRYP